MSNAFVKCENLWLNTFLVCLTLLLVVVHWSPLLVKLRVKFSFLSFGEKLFLGLYKIKVTFRDFEILTFKGIVYIIVIPKEKDYGKNERYYGRNSFIFSLIMKCFLVLVFRNFRSVLK